MGIGTLYRVAVKSVGSLTAEVPYAWNARHYVVLSGPSADTTADLIEAFQQTAEPALLASFSRSARIRQYQASLAVTPKVITATKDVDEQGDFLVESYMPSFLCGLVRLHWEVGGDNRKVGKVYVPWIGVPKTNAIGSSITTRLTSIADAMAIDTVTSPAGMVYRPVVYHAATNTADRVFSATASSSYHCYRARGRTVGDFSMSFFRGLCSLP